MYFKNWLLYFLCIFVSSFFISACDKIGIGGKKSLVIISSYDAEYSWVKAYENALTLGIGNRYDIKRFYLDSHHSSESGSKDKAHDAIEFIKSNNPDLIVVAADAALKLTAPSLALMENIPVVFIGVKSPPQNYFGTWPKNITGAIEYPLLHKNIEIIKTINKNAKKIAILFDGNIASKSIRREFFAEKDNVKIGDIEVDLCSVSSYKEWQYFVSGVDKRYDACILGLYGSLVDNAGQLVDAGDVLRWTSSNCAIPLFCFWDFSIGSAMALGGQVVSGEEQGKIGVEIIQRIEAGEKPALISPILGSSGKLMFSKERLVRYGITLPESLAASAILVD